MTNQAAATRGMNWSWDPQQDVITIFDATGSRVSDGRQWAICSFSQLPEPTEGLQKLLIINSHNDAVAVGPMTAVKLFLAGIVGLVDLQSALESDRTIICRDVKVNEWKLKVKIEPETKALQRKWFDGKRKAALGKARLFIRKCKEPFSMPPHLLYLTKYENECKTPIRHQG